jgi:hypothetical protein
LFSNLNLLKREHSSEVDRQQALDFLADLIEQDYGFVEGYWELDFAD